ncbi:hypothetical protein KA021_01600 [Candidatus Saccharibacteria bacterium]|jgi:hypothetical protein|nr:hypothetical protein [Candidatus Saccharibacteria bacterium]
MSERQSVGNFLRNPYRRCGVYAAVVLSLAGCGGGSPNAGHLNTDSGEKLTALEVQTMIDESLQNDKLGVWVSPNALTQIEKGGVKTFIRPLGEVDGEIGCRPDDENRASNASLLYVIDNVSNTLESMSPGTVDSRVARTEFRADLIGPRTVDCVFVIQNRLGELVLVSSHNGEILSVAGVSDEPARRAQLAPIK